MVTSVIKFGADLAISTGIGMIGNGVATKIIPETTSKVAKVCCWTGFLATESFVSYKVCTYAEETIDELAGLGKALLVKTKKEEKKDK